jgi:hypothetical protein
MPIRHGKAIWPGALGVESCTYTLSHGISPGVAILKVTEQEDLPAEVGNLIITDDVGTVTIPDCKVDSMVMEHNASGRVWSFAILDRRWKWRDLGQISGCYNQLDPHSKLIPWTIRSPRELAVLCLEAMGERNYEIDMPPGLSRADGANPSTDPAHLGVIPTTGTNPPVNWEQEPPAQALTRLCEIFGRRVIYQLDRNRVLIARQGIGGTLPDNYSIASETPSIDSPETPTGVAVAGAPTKYQARFWLEAVGRDWNGHYYPIDQLSYAPRFAGKNQITVIDLNLVNPACTGTFTIRLNAEDDPEEGVEFEVSVTAVTDLFSAASDLADLINASEDPRIRGVISAEATDNTILLTGDVVGQTWSVQGECSSADASVLITQNQAAQVAGVSWELCNPESFPGVRAPDQGDAAGRLTYEEARALARETVFRCYRLTLIAPVGEGALRIPGYGGDIVRRQQIELLDTKVEQVTPVPLDPQIVNPNAATLGTPGAGQTPTNVARVDFYNGYSRDLPAAMTGSISVFVARNSGRVFWTRNTATRENSADDDRIHVPFTIDPVEQVVTFSVPVYRTRNQRFYPINKPVLETGCYIRNAETNSFEASYSARVLPNMRGVTNFAVRKYPDVQLFLIGQYDANGNTNGARSLEADAFERASHYLDGLEAQYLVEGALTREYNGIVPIDCDGAISQVTWEVGGSGASTKASRNSEHSIYVPPYRARRRAEFLAAPQQAALEARQQNIGAGLFGGVYMPLSLLIAMLLTMWRR